MIETAKLRKLRIGFIGNTNNYPLILASAFRSLGHEVTLFLDQKDLLHRPEGRDPRLYNPLPEWIIDISSFHALDFLFSTEKRNLLNKSLRTLDFLVLNGRGLALAAGQHMNIFCLLTGSDLEYKSNPSCVRVEFKEACNSIGLIRGIFSAFVFALFVRLQRRSLAKAFGFNWFEKGLFPLGDGLLTGIGHDLNKNTSFMLSDLDSVFPTPMQDLSCGLRIFNVARLNWKEPRPSHLSELDMKGTDVLLRGFAIFARAQGNKTSRLVLVRKGHDITATEQLVNDLGIGSQVDWLNELSQAEVVEQYSAAHVIADQLSTNVVGMGGLNALAAGRPVIANARPEIFDRVFGESSTILHATTPEQVASHLQSLASNHALLAQQGRAAREFVERHFSPRLAAEKILSLFWEVHQTESTTRQHEN